VVILAGVIAAICWNLLTWLGIPSSSSHTLMGSWELQLLMRLLYMVFRLFTGGWNYCLLVRHRTGIKQGRRRSAFRCFYYILFYSISTFSGALMSYLISILAFKCV
jgi:PiT family inorganic phosphate transporter